MSHLFSNHQWVKSDSLTPGFSPQIRRSHEKQEKIHHFGHARAFPLHLLPSQPTNLYSKKNHTEYGDVFATTFYIDEIRWGVSR